MGLSTQRMIMILLFLDIVIMGSIAFAYSYNNMPNEADKFTTSFDDFTSDFDNKFTDQNIDTENQYLEQQVGNARGAWKTLYSVFHYISIPDSVSCETQECNSGIVRYMNWGLRFFVILINVLLVLEVYLLFANKKT